VTEGGVQSGNMCIVTEAAVKLGNERSLMKTAVAQSGNVTAVK